MNRAATTSPHYLSSIEICLRFAASWDLSPKEQGRMFGFELASDAQLDALKELLRVWNNFDIQARLDVITDLKGLVSRACRQEEQREWVRQPREELDGDSVYDCLIAGDMDELVRPVA